MKEAYGWTFNLCINPKDIICLVIWIGNTCYSWRIKKPLTINSGPKLTI